MTRLALLGLGLLSLLLSAGLVLPLRGWARRRGLVDDPATGAYKTHTGAVPYGGGLAICLGAALPLAAALGMVAADRWDFFYFGGQWSDLWAPVSLYPGFGVALTVRQLSQAVCLFGAGLCMLLVGLADDWRRLPPLPRLAAQVAAATLVATAIPEARLPLVGGGLGAATATVVWIVAFTNAFNFLDNMNGLAAGLAAIVLAVAGAMAVGLGHLPAALLCLALVGACGGFLIFNFPDATIFMGDAGGLFLGFVAGSLTALLSNLATAAAGSPSPYGLAPLIVLGLPAYDLVTVVAVRLRRGQAPWKGDTNHVSHRLVRLGLSRRNAVLVLYCVALTAAAPGLVALFLPRQTAWIPLAGTAAWLVTLGLLDWWSSTRR